MKRQIIEVKHPDYGYVYLNVDKIIAISLLTSKVYFENVVWELSDEDMKKIYQIWNNNKTLND